MNTKNIALGIVVVAVIAVAVFALGTQPVKNSQPNITNSPTKIMENTEKRSALKDGIYDATGEYSTPGGSQKVGVKISLKDGLIKSADVENMATGDISIKMQNKFIEGFNEMVVGKSIDEVDITVVNGSSLTSKGFLDALDQIKAKAQAS